MTRGLAILPCAFVVLLDCADRKTRISTISLPKLATRLRNQKGPKRTRETAWRAIQELESAGHIYQLPGKRCDSASYQIVTHVTRDTAEIAQGVALQRTP
jgi:hypothetical protein